MNPQEWFRPPRAVLTLFICLMLVCALALGWLGWRVLEQDRAVEAQGRQERLESAADRVVAAIERAFDAADMEVTVAANESGDAQVRAEALVRLGRVLRHERRWVAALKAYAAFEKSGAPPVAGMPANPVPRAARCEHSGPATSRGSVT